MFWGLNRVCLLDAFVSLCPCVLFRAAPAPALMINRPADSFPTRSSLAQLFPSLPRGRGARIRFLFVATLNEQNLSLFRPRRHLLWLTSIRKERTSERYCV